MGPIGWWYVNGHDLFLNYSLAIREGTAGFLQYPAKKESIINDWWDATGIDIDLTKKFFKERAITLRMWGITETENDFWMKHNAFIAELAKPGSTRITITAFQSRSYFVYFSECSGYTQIKGSTLRNIPEHMIVHEFNLTVIEPQPQIGNSDTFIAADNGEFLIV